MLSHLLSALRTPIVRNNNSISRRNEIEVARWPLNQKSMQIFISPIIHFAQQRVNNLKMKERMKKKHFLLRNWNSSRASFIFSFAKQQQYPGKNETRRVKSVMTWKLEWKVRLHGEKWRMQKTVEVTCRGESGFSAIEDNATKLKEAQSFGDAMSGRTFPSNRINNNENRVFHRLW